MISNASYWIRSGLFTLFEKLSVQAFGLGSAILLFRLFSKDTMSTWVLFLALTSIIEVARVGILQNALVKYLVNKEGDDYRKISTASLVLNLIFTVFSVLVLAVGAKPIALLFKRPALEELFYIYIITTVVLVPFIQSNYTQQANLDFKGVFWSNFVKQGLLFAAIAGSLFLGWSLSLSQLAIYQLVAAAFGTLVAVVLAKPYLRFSKIIDRAWLKELFNFGIYVFGTNVSTMLYKNTDKMWLGAIPGVGTAAVALYEAAIKVTNLVEVPTYSMANILYPQSARRANEGMDGVRALYEKAVGAVLAFLVPIIIVIFLFPEPFVLIMAGRDYIEAAPILRVTILFGLFIPYAINFGTVLDSIGKPDVNFLFTVVYMLLNIGVNYLFIMNFGIIGAAWGTLTTFALTFVAMQTYLHKTIGVNPLQPWREAVLFYQKIFRMVSAKLKGQPLTVNSSDEKSGGL